MFKAFNLFYKTLLSQHYRLSYPLYSPEVGKPLPLLAKVFRFLLMLCSWFYGLGVYLRNKAYDFGLLKAFTPAVLVISIGNLTTGGTGKTPVTLALAEGLLRSGLSVVVLSRGYGALRPQAQPCLATHPNLGDEPYWLQQRLSSQAGAAKANVVVCKNRVEAAKWSCQHLKPDVLLLDDGFQHRRLNRQINVLLIDGQRLLGNKALLPLGPLREPISALQRATIIGLTKLQPDSEQAKQAMAQLALWLKRYWPEGKALPPVFVLPFTYGALQPIFPEAVGSNRPQAGEKALLVSALANPQAFELAVIEQTRLNVLQHLAFTDHCTYQNGEIETLQSVWQQSNRPYLLTSEKDAVKLKPHLPKAMRAYCWVLPFEAQLPEALLQTVLDAFYNV